MFIRLLILVTLCSCSHGEDLEYRYDYTYIKEANGWLKLHFSPMLWEDAKLQCYQEGAVLASPLNRNLAIGLTKLWQKQRMCPTVMFSGVSSIFAPGVYTSVEGVPLERISLYWSIDEPVFFPKGCLVFYSNGTMGSKSCNDHFPFNCYKEHTELVKNECGTVDNEYHRVSPNASSCYKCHPQEEDWSRAFAICQAEGAHLAIINETEATELRSWILSKLQTKKAAIGFKHIDGVWWDIHGNLMGSRRMQSQRTTSSKSKCVALTMNSEFEEISCKEKHAFICQKAVSSLLN